MSSFTWTFLQGIFVFNKMSEIDKPLRKSVRKRQFPNEEQLSEQFLIYKNRRSGYVSELTKLIKKIKTSLENKDYSKLGDYDNRLANIITKVRRVTTKLIDLVSGNFFPDDFYHKNHIVLQPLFYLLNF